jgi:hypothetical protein
MCPLRQSCHSSRVDGEAAGFVQTSEWSHAKSLLRAKNLILVRKHRPARIDLCVNMPYKDDSMEMSCSSLTSALPSRRKSHPFLQPNVRLADHHKHMPQHHASGLKSLSSKRTRVCPTSCVNHLPEHTTHLVRVESSGRLVSAECQYTLLPRLVEMQRSLISDEMASGFCRCTLSVCALARHTASLTCRGIRRAHDEMESKTVFQRQCLYTYRENRYARALKPECDNGSGETSWSSTKSSYSRRKR